MALTSQQRLALTYVEQFFEAHDEPCSCAFVARRMGLSRTVARRHLSALVRAGLVVSTSCLRPSGSVLSDRGAGTSPEEKYSSMRLNSVAPTEVVSITPSRGPGPGRQ